MPGGIEKPSGHGPWKPTQMALLEHGGVALGCLKRSPPPFPPQPFCDLQPTASLDRHSVPHSAPVLLSADLLHQTCTTAPTALSATSAACPSFPEHSVRRRRSCSLQLGRGASHGALRPKRSRAG